MKYQLSYETGEARCVWCWERIDPVDSHAVVAATRPPYAKLRLHHDCWAVYRYVSGLELKEKGTGYVESWTPERLERLRLHLGVPTARFAQSLGISYNLYLAIMAGEHKANISVRQKARHLAILNRFNTQGNINWSDNRAVFCFRMEMGWTSAELRRRLGVRFGSVVKWCDKGVPLSSIQAWARLDRLASLHNFDAGMIVNDRLWTNELVVAAFEKSKKSAAEWARASNFLHSSMSRILRGETRILRGTAWRLTRAAAKFNLELPPVGIITEKQRK